MVKYVRLFIVIIFGYLPFLKAQTDICDIFWWQQVTVAEIEMLTIDNGAFYSQCSNGETPIIMAAKAGVSREVLTAAFELIAYNAIAKSLNKQSRFGDDGRLYFLDKLGKYDDPTERLSIDVQVDLKGLLEANSN